ncbi:MAG: acetyl-CoA C-acyltransferase [Actinomycetota bacterium]|jgi:acetyl-CoA C-acetyltransferase|nr:acetyl-CoA C-acyltransferase [Actinomycetota bacterium]
MPQAVIVDVVRTPIGRAFKGSLAPLRPDNAGAFIVDELLARNPDVDPATVEEVVTGCGLPQGRQAFNIGRAIALLSDKLPETVNGSTISRYCASGLDAIRIAANNVTAGQGDVYIAAGVEAVSQYNERQEAAGESDQNSKLQGSEPGQPDVYIGMGFTAVNVAKKYGVSREAMDEYAQRSQELAVASQQSGFFDREIAPVTLPDDTVVSKDDGPRASSSIEKLAELPEAFGGGGVTAGNSCPLNDGAAAALIMSEERATELGLKPRARIITAATWGNEPELMGVAPIGAIKKALDRAGMTIADIDTVELNEAFAAQVIPIMDECGIPLEKMNPHGGAIALGHPFGMTGVRIMTTLLNGLESDDRTIGLETMCVAGGQGEAMIVERIG